MHIGLIGGIGPAATDVYYRGLVGAARQMDKPLEMTIAHADAPTLLANQDAGRVAEQCAIFDRLTQRLAAAGAQAVAITAVAGHFCIDEFKAVSPLPVIDVIEAVAQRMRRDGINRVGILGTRAVMASDLYGKLGGVGFAALPPAELASVHDAYVALAGAGRATPAMRATFDAAVATLQAQGAQAVLLGGTDLATIYNEETAAFPAIDCAQVHISAIADQMA